MDCAIYAAKTKALISFAGKLICVFVFAYAKSRVSHHEAQILQVLSFSKMIHGLIQDYLLTGILGNGKLHGLSKICH